MTRPTSGGHTLPRIQLLVCPGTLPSVGKHRMDLFRYRESGIPRLTGEQLLGALPEASSLAHVEVDPGNPWDHTTHDALRAIALHVDRLLRSTEIDGVVVVQGTNTLEETAYFLSLTVGSDKPIVITGAQRPFNGLSSDAPINLLDAIRVASTGATRGKGAVVVANGEINAARDVTKTNTYGLHTFRSRDLGVLGYVAPDRIEFYRTPHRRHTTRSEFQIERIASLPYVEIVYIHTGNRPGLARAVVELGAEGVVIAGAGAGAPGALEDEIGEIMETRRVLVLQSSRVGEGRVVRDNNWYTSGMVVADNLSPQKAALLLALALTKSRDPAHIQRIFDEY